MHNISGGGFGFWSKRELGRGEAILVREWSDTTKLDWLPARVTHCTAGLQGYLIGAAFENPCPPGERSSPPPLEQDMATDEAAVHAEHEADEDLTAKDRGRLSLSMRCAMTTASVSLLSVVAVIVVMAIYGDTRWSPIVPAEADADKMSQVISNLLSNAIKYTPNGGTVRLSVEVRGSDILLRVSDTGPGIPRDKWDQLFDRFSQLGDPNVTEIDGFGLGLYIVKRIVECHGGVAWLDSEVGKGSEFCVSLPIKSETEDAVRDHTLSPTAGRVLICDPDPEFAATLSKTLRWANIDARVCHSGARLLAQLAHGDIDVVVTELLLPDINASELLDALKDYTDRSFRVVIHSYAVDEPQLEQYGVETFLKRPVSKEVFVQAIRDCLVTKPQKVLLIEGGCIDARKMERLVSDTPHSLSIVATLKDAIERISDEGADVILVPEATLKKRWEQLAALGSASKGSTGIMVLCENPGPTQDELAQTHGVTVLAVAQEERLLDYLNGSVRQLQSEITGGGRGP